VFKGFLFKQEGGFPFFLLQPHLWGVIGAITAFFVIGIFVLIADGIWVIYRIVKGWLNLSDKKKMYA